MQRFDLEKRPPLAGPDSIYCKVTTTAEKIYNLVSGGESSDEQQKAVELVDDIIHHMADPSIVSESSTLRVDLSTPCCLTVTGLALAQAGFFLKGVQDKLTALPKPLEPLKECEIAIMEVATSAHLNNKGLQNGIKWILHVIARMKRVVDCPVFDSDILAKLTELAFVVHIRLVMQFKVFGDREIHLQCDSQYQSDPRLPKFDEMRKNRKSVPSQSEWTIWDELNTWSASPLGLRQWMMKYDTWGSSNGKGIIAPRIGTEKFERILKCTKFDPRDIDKEPGEEAKRAASLWVMAMWWETFNIQRAIAGKQDDKRVDVFASNYFIQWQEWGSNAAVEKLASLSRSYLPIKCVLAQTGMDASTWAVIEIDHVHVFNDVRGAILKWIDLVGPHLEGGFPTPKPF